MKKLFIFISLITISFLQAQQQKDSVKTEVVNVTHSFNPTVQDAYKLAVNPDSIHVIEKKIPVRFKIQSVPVASTFMPEKGSMKKIHFSPDISNNNASYVQLGAGNYTHILFDSYVYYPVTEKLSAGVNINHFSSQGTKNDTLRNPYHNTKADVLLNYKNEKSQFGLDIGYTNVKHKLNKSPIIINDPIDLGDYDIDYANNNIFNFGVNGNFNDLFIKDFNINFQNFWDKDNDYENKLNFNSTLTFPIGNVSINTGLRGDLVTGKSSLIPINYNNFDAGVLPSFVYDNENFNIKLGAKIFYQNFKDYKKVQFFPDVLANLNIVYEKLSIYGGLNGDIFPSSFIELSSRNPYMKQFGGIKPELMPIEIFGGIKGSFSSSFAYRLKMGFRQLKNHPFYYGIPFYNLIYTAFYGNLKQSYFSSEVNVGIGKKLDFKFNFTYYQNNTGHFSRALFMPDYTIKSMINFRPTEKLTFNFTVDNLSERTYMTNATLGSFTDLNLEVRYKINKDFTAFILGNNLLNKSYQIYYLYPVEKLQIQAGVMYKFDLSKN